MLPNKTDKTKDCIREDFVIVCDVNVAVSLLIK